MPNLVVVPDFFLDKARNLVPTREISFINLAANMAAKRFCMVSITQLDCSFGLNESTLRTNFPDLDCQAIPAAPAVQHSLGSWLDHLVVLPTHLAIAQLLTKTCQLAKRCDWDPAKARIVTFTWASWLFHHCVLVTAACNVNPGLINHGLLIRGYSPNSGNLILKWYLPNQTAYCRGLLIRG